MKETHYITAYTERNGRFQLAACNIWIREDEHSSEPSCPSCKKYVEDACRELNAEDLFGKFDPLDVVKPSFSANSDAHYNSYTEKRR